MKKQICTLLICIAASFAASAQTSAKDSLLKVMAKEVCAEFSKHDSLIKSGGDFEALLEEAFAPLLTKYEAELESILQLDINNQEAMETFGKELGLQLAAECPDFLMLIAESKQRAEKTEAAEKIVTSKLRGTLVKIVPGEISYLQVKDKTGKLEKIWWLEYFNGSNILTESPAKLLNKSVTVSYVEKDIYNARLKKYVTMKIITGLD